MICQGEFLMARLFTSHAQTTSDRRNSYTEYCEVKFPLLCNREKCGTVHCRIDHLRRHAKKGQNNKRLVSRLVDITG